MLMLVSFLILCIGDVSNEYEEAYWDEDGEEIYTEFPCPYCNDDFDLVELCCHIEDVHFLQSKNGVGNSNPFILL